MRAVGVAIAAALLGILTMAAVPAEVAGQSARPPARPPARRPAAQPPLKTEPAAIMCPNPLGEGVQSKTMFCDVLTGREPADGILVTLPPHTGPATLTFDLHNRHMYSEELVKTNRGYRRYTATIGVLTMDNTLLSRAIVQNEFRTSADLVDRISGGAGPGGVKAVAPTGRETVSITIPMGETTVSILGEKLTVVRLDGIDNFSLPGQPVAIISNVMLEYRPAPPPRSTAPRRR